MGTSYTWGSFRIGLEDRVSDIRVFENADKTNIRMILPSESQWIIINPHATLEYFCDHYSSCDVSVKCCERHTMEETAEQLQARHQWNTRHPIKLSREKMSRLILAAGWALDDAFDALNDIAF